MVGKGRQSRVEIAAFHGGEYPKINKKNLRWIFSKNDEEILAIQSTMSYHMCDQRVKKRQNFFWKKDEKNPSNCPLCN
jgi:predicted esterase YcpF (UPF0227 family)